MLCNRNQHSVVGQLYFENKQTHRKRDQICSCQRLGGWRENWTKALKSTHFQMRKLSTQDIMFNMTGIINSAVCYIQKLLRELIL